MMETPHTTTTNKKSRILIVDDHPIVRQGLVKLLEQEPDLSVCGEAESADEAMESITRTQPDLTLLDLSLRGKPGLELIKDIQIQHPQVLVLVLSMHDEVIWAERTLRAGACGYVMKQEKPRELLSKIRQALRGEVSLSDRMSERLLRRATGRQPARLPGNVEVLGDRELEVLQLIGEGLDTRHIAAAMHISQKTVEAHREHIKQKLMLGSGAELLRYAVLRAFGDT